MVEEEVRVNDFSSLSVFTFIINNKKFSSSPRQLKLKNKYFPFSLKLMLSVLSTVVAWAQKHSEEEEEKLMK